MFFAYNPTTRPLNRPGFALDSSQYPKVLHILLQGYIYPARSDTPLARCYTTTTALWGFQVRLRCSAKPYTALAKAYKAPAKPYTGFAGAA